MELLPRPPSATSHLLNVYFCAWTVAGVRSQYESIRSVAGSIDDVSMHYVEIIPHKADGVIERLPLLGSRTKGSMRSFASTLPLFRANPIDVVWTQRDTALFPFMFTRARWGQIPYAISTDCTATQIESMSEYRFESKGPIARLKYWMRDGILQASYRHAALIMPWSRWAATAIIHEYAVPEERVAVIPPGLDLDFWALPVRPPRHPREPMRLLFVGGDFARKGGPLLLDVFRASLRGRCELHLVTKEPLENEPGVFVYRDLGPNDPRLHHLYETADALVLPTRADCFSLASIEAMATGIPVITCGVGGIPEIVENGASGWLVPVGDGTALYQAIDALLTDPTQAVAMGRRGRAIVEQRFDAAKNTRAAFALLRSAYCQRKRAHAYAPLRTPKP